LKGVIAASSSLAAALVAYNASQDSVGQKQLIKVKELRIPGAQKKEPTAIHAVSAATAPNPAKEPLERKLLDFKKDLAPGLWRPAPPPEDTYVAASHAAVSNLCRGLLVRELEGNKCDLLFTNQKLNSLAQRVVAKNQKCHFKWSFDIASQGLPDCMFRQSLLVNFFLSYKPLVTW
jgi:hypothetical protein